MRVHAPELAYDLRVWRYGWHEEPLLRFWERRLPAILRELFRAYANRTHARPWYPPDLELRPERVDLHWHWNAYGLGTAVQIVFWGRSRHWSARDAAYLTAEALLRTEWRWLGPMSLPPRPGVYDDKAWRLVTLTEVTDADS